MPNKTHRLFCTALVLIFAVVTAFTGCGSTPSSVPNPAAEKCIRDGFELKPIVVNGVPQGSHCVDPKSGKRCDVWEYYRDQCDLGVRKK